MMSAKIMKKLISVILTFAMIISFLPISAMAEEVTQNETEYYAAETNSITVPDEAYIVSKGVIKGIYKSWFNEINPSGETCYLKLVIPDQINGVAITGIASYALQYKNNGFQDKASVDLSKIKITEVDFSKAKNLESINSFAFDQRPELAGILDFSNTKVTTIGAAAFRGTAITNVVLPDELTTLGDVKSLAGTFAECKQLLSVTYASYTGSRAVAFPETLTTIGKQCFRNSFPKGGSFAVDIPASVAYIGAEAFNTNNNDSSSRFSTIYIKRGSDYSGYDKYAFQNGKSFIVFPDTTSYTEALKQISNSKIYIPTYELNVMFQKKNGGLVTTQTKLYNQEIYYEKRADDVWAVNNDYTLPALADVTLKPGYEIGWYFESNGESIDNEATVNDGTTAPEKITVLTDGIKISEPQVTVSGPNYVCEGSNITLKAEITNKVEGFQYKYRWAKYNFSTEDWDEIAGETSDTLQVTDGRNYYLAAVTAVDGDNHQSEEGGDYLYVYQTTHNWSYVSNENKITVNCENSGCKYETEGVTSALNAEDMVYTGKPYDKATFGTEVTDLTGVTAGMITYYVDGTTEPLREAPSAIGTYRACITLSNGVSASKVFHITKQKIYPQVMIDAWEYGSYNETKNLPKLEENSNPGKGKVTFEYYTDAKCTRKTTVDDGAKAEGGVPKNAGTYYVKASISETDYYAAGEATASFEITKKTVGVKWSDTEFVYDGTSKQPTATATGLIDGDICDVAVSGLATDAGTYTAKAENVTNSNYQLPADVETVYVIRKADPVYITVPEAKQDMVYNGTNQNLISEGKTNDGTLMYKLEDGEWTTELPTGLNAGDYTLFYKIVGDSNHNDSAESQLTITIAKAPVTITANDAEKHVKMEDPELYDTISGVVGMEQLNGVIIRRESGEAVGTYTINVIADAAANPNYAITTVSGTFTINDHDWSGEWKKVKEATATENGKREKTCAYEGCEQKLYESIPATDVPAEPEKPSEGILRKDVEVTPDSPISEATLDNTKSELLKSDGIFTKTEKVAISSGTNARVWLEITGVDVSTISNDDKLAMEEAAKKIMGENLNLTYFNAELFKQVEGVAKTQIHEPGTMIKVTIQIPEELLNHDKSIAREYKILRLHHGKVDVISGTFNAATNEFTFESDKFSTYAIAYGDTQLVTGVSLDTTEKTLTKAGETLQLTATVAPENAANKKLHWSSSDPKIATVDENGLVTAVSNGTAIITVTTEEGSYTATCTITVNIPAKTLDSKLTNNNTSNKTNTKENTSSAKAPKTGDSNQMAVWFVIVFCAAGTMIVAERKRRKQQ